MGHGRALINIEQQEEQLKIYEKIISKGLSVRNTEVLVQKLNLGKENKKKYAKISEVHIDAENELKKYLNSSVFVKFNKKGKGSIIIPFDSNKSLNDLIKKIKRED
jgi:ParB family chromosome partitioning protein